MYSRQIKLMSMFILLAFSLGIFAQDQGELSIVAVGEATTLRDKILIQDSFTGNNQQSLVKNSAIEFAQLLRNDFSFYQKKFFVEKAAQNNSLSRPLTNYDYWQKNGIRYLVGVSFEKFNGKEFKINVILEDIKNKKQMVNQTVTATVTNLRKTGHEVANTMYKSIVGQDSIFRSKIFFVSDRNSRGSKIIKEIYVMDFDGKNVRQLTRHQGMAIGPAISPNGRYMAYSVIPNENIATRNNNLYLMDLETEKTTILSQKEGINSGAVFLQDGKHIALTLTISGNADIYEMNIESKSLRKLTNHFSQDVDPSITASGQLMTFLSNRSGMAMIYTMNPSETEKNVKRISYVGKFNATPRFSPDGKEIVFSSWLDETFDLFRISSDGNSLVRLTKDFGSNEDPSFSPDAEFIVFTSQRVLSRKSAEQNLYIMDRDGEILGAVTKDFGKCISPRWHNM